MTQPIQLYGTINWGHLQAAPILPPILPPIPSQYSPFFTPYYMTLGQLSEKVVAQKIEYEKPCR